MHSVPDELERWPTPFIYADIDRVQRNLRTMAFALKDLGVRLRPHVKTHKIPELAQLQVASGATGVTVATLAEARVFAAAGIDDLFFAHQLIDHLQIEQLLRLAGDVRISVAVDGPEGARALSAAARERGREVEVLLEIDLGIGRSGVSPDRAAELAAVVARQPGLRLVGVYGFRGYPHAAAEQRDRVSWGREEGEMLVAAADRLRAAGHAIARVSAGSTPTALPAACVPGVTEARPGQYVFGGANVVAQGAMSLDDVALFVRATVVSRPDASRVVIDAGSKALGADHSWRPGDGFGYLAEDPSCTLVRLWEEHGVLATGPEVRDIRVGDRVSIVPNHVCSTINLHEQLFVIRAGRLEETWAVRARRSDP